MRRIEWVFGGVLAGGILTMAGAQTTGRTRPVATPSVQLPTGLDSKPVAAQGAKPVAGALQVARLTNLRRVEVLKLVDREATFEGFYYDGSIPMLIDDITRVHKNEMIPEDAYLALHGAPLKGVRSGDRIALKGKVVRGTAAMPTALRTQTAVLQLAAVPTLEVVKKTPVEIGRSTLRVIDFPKVIDFTSDKYAVLISGGANAANNHLRYWNELKATYNMLKARGWKPANMFVIYADGVGRDNSIPVHYLASAANIKTVFTNLAAKMGGADTLYIMLNDHGGNGANAVPKDATLNLWGTSITDVAFAAEVNRIQKYKKMIVQMEQCYSGGFLDDLAGPNRIMMSACTADQPSWAMGPSYTWNWYTYFYLAALTGQKPDGAGPVDADVNNDGKVSMAEAHNFARANDQANEQPQMEDNGAAPSAAGAMPAGGEGLKAAQTFLN